MRKYPGLLLAFLITAHNDTAGIQIIIQCLGFAQELRAEHLAEAISADLFEIAPKVRYTKKDLDWKDQASRSSVEMRDPSCRPEMEMLRDNILSF